MSRTTHESEWRDDDSSQVTPSYFLRTHGEPARQRRDGDTEIWVYDGEWRWVGIGLWAVVVPVPLMLPVARDRLEVTFRAGRAVSRKRRKTDYSALFYCGYWSTVEDRNYLGALTCGSGL